MYRLVFQSFPNNEVRWGFDELPYIRTNHGDKKPEKDREMAGKACDNKRQRYLEENNITEYRDSYGTLWRSKSGDAYTVRPQVRRDLVLTSEVQEGSKTSLGLSDPRYLKPVSRTVFTRNARHRLLEAGYICEESRGRDRPGIFVTFTQPGSRRDSYDVLSRYSGYVCNRVLQVLRDDKRAVSWFYVWERQRRGALHLHLFLLLEKGQAWDSYREPLRTAWYNALRDVDESGQGDLFGHADGEYCTASSFWRFDYQEVHKSVGGYLSKYVSKNAEQGFSSVPGEADAGVYPRRWWGMSRDLTREINQRRKHISADAVLVEDCISALDCMDAMAEDIEPVIKHSYVADIGRSQHRDGSFGTSYRRIAYFKPEEFADAELALRSRFIKLIASMQKARVTFRGFALDYGGERLTPLEL